MANSKHIFFQLDTDSIILGIDIINERFKGQEKSKAKIKAAISNLVKSHTLVYSQGSMVMGSPIASFTVDVEKGQDVYFSVMPLVLYSYHKLYFNSFTIDNEKQKTNPSLKKSDQHVSFKFCCDEKPGTINYHLAVTLNYTDLYGVENSLDLDIDPRLKIRQTAG